MAGLLLDQCEAAEALNGSLAALTRPVVIGC